MDQVFCGGNCCNDNYFGVWLGYAQGFCNPALSFICPIFGVSDAHLYLGFVAIYPFVGQVRFRFGAPGEGEGE